MTATGPIYNVPLTISTLPLDGGMIQQMPGRDDLDYATGKHTRLVAGYEVLLAHYQRAIRDAERYRKLRANHWSQGGLVVTDVKNIAFGSADCPSLERLDEMIDKMGGEPVK